jgi:hypothetical protein
MYFGKEAGFPYCWVLSRAGLEPATHWLKSGQAGFPLSSTTACFINCSGFRDLLTARLGQGDHSFIPYHEKTNQNRPTHFMALFAGILLHD